MFGKSTSCTGFLPGHICLCEESHLMGICGIDCRGKISVWQRTVFGKGRKHVDKASPPMWCLLQPELDCLVSGTGRRMLSAPIPKYLLAKCLKDRKWCRRRSTLNLIVLSTEVTGRDISRTSPV